ncbi:MAG: ABC transporter substrate-binding protein [Clostridiales Family XIII bacterium]|nr:ABC transporter substrate-binding protein [Clostridiales Family XIII bacterium]
MAACGGGESDGSGGGGGGGGDAADDTAAITEAARANTQKAAADAANEDAKSTKDTLTFAATMDPGKISLDNLLDMSTYPFAYAVVEYFIRYDFVEGKFFSPVCESYEADADGLGVTFHLIPGIMMHDGEELTSEDIVASMLAFRNDSGLGWQLDFVDVDKTKIIDDHTIDIRFNAPNGVWEASFMMFTLISKKAYDELGPEKFYQAPVSPAQYYVKEWKSGEQITVEAFKDYYKGEPKIKNMVMKIVSDDTASFMELQSGSVDLVWNLNADQVKSVAASDDLQLLMTEDLLNNWMGMNCANKALSDFRVRQAIWYAVNRDDIILGAFDGFANPSPSILAPSALGYDSKYETEPPYPPDIEKAKQLMKDAGYEGGLTLRLLAESTTNFQLVSEQLSAMLAEIGITLDITLTDYATENSIMYGGDDQAYDLFLFFCLTSDESIAYIDNPMLFGASRWNDSADGSGADFSEIMKQIRSTPDIDARAQLYKDMQAYFFEKGLYWLPLTNAQTYIGCSADLTGFGLRGQLLDFKNVYFK